MQQLTKTDAEANGYHQIELRKCGGRVGGRGIPQMACESLPHSFGKRGEVCFVFMGVDLCGFPLGSVGECRLSYLIRKGL